MAIDIIEIDEDFTMAIREAYKRGCDDFAAGKPIDANPYPSGSVTAHNWRVAWCKANYNRSYNQRQ